MTNSTQSGSATTFDTQEGGFLLLGVLFMVLLILIALAIAAPKVAESIRRDKEDRNHTPRKAICPRDPHLLRKYGRYPNSIDQLMKTDNQRFLRKRYLDPMTGKDDWRIIHLGEATGARHGLVRANIAADAASRLPE